MVWKRSEKYRFFWFILQNPIIKISERVLEDKLWALKVSPLSEVNYKNIYKYLYIHLIPEFIEMLNVLRNFSTYLETVYGTWLKKSFQIDTLNTLFKIIHTLVIPKEL